MKKETNRYVVLAACCFINLCLGSIYSWSVFAQAMTQYLNNTYSMSLIAADLAVVYTVANCIGPITMITGGRINDLLGPKKVIFVGGILFGAGLFMSGFARSVVYLVVSFGIIGGLGLGMAYGSTVSTAVKFFPDKRGLAGGITTAAYGLSSVILPPVIGIIVGKMGAPFTFKIIGIVFLLVISFSTIFVDKYEDDNKVINFAASENDKNWKQMIIEPVFFVMLVLLICGAFSGMMIISQASSIASNMMGMSITGAAVIVSMLAAFNTLGRLVAGYFSDRFGRIVTLRLSCILSVFAQVCLIYSKDVTTLFYIGIAVVGIAFGAFMGIYPGFTADTFGSQNNSVNYGIMCIGFSLAGWLGPQIMKNIYTNFGNYTNAFISAMIFALLGLFLTFLYEFLGNRR